MRSGIIAATEPSSRVQIICRCKSYAQAGVRRNQEAPAASPTEKLIDHEIEASRSPTHP